ncbi:MAG TPA: hypothetical protein VGV07_21905 [Devosia sp.]|jgi:hypothetical protein|uniref:hypothetical protein n=1 Tax=Devosia sp. TaxID=1871048 RepID=UPI002DDD6213|nr:hypothetical protein [Devosia sp.]HEV2517922.1 hypothetical protein [Devosia sp.]
MDKVQNITRRGALIGALVSTAAIVSASAVTAAGTSSPISTLFPEWLALREGSGDENFARYLDLQERITGSTPAGARELAMQFVVETDDGDSDFRDAFFARVRQLAMEG